MMKYIILFTLAFSSSTVLLAQTTSASSANVTTGESALNQKLLDNAAASQKLLQSASGTSPVVPVFGGPNTSNSIGSKTTNLTDQEKQLSENYVDQGQANRIMQAKCTGEMVQGCSGNEVDHKVMGMSPTMIKMASQAYASFGAMTDFLPVSKGTGEMLNAAKPVDEATKKAADEAAKTTGDAAKKTADGTPPKDPKNPKEKATDYCKYIPAATEGLAKFSQQTNVQAAQANAGGDTSQKEALLEAAKSHDSRAKQAQIQAVGWFGGAGCYAYEATTGAFAVDTALVVKLGAATLLGTFYQAEVGANKDYAQKTRDIANSLPSKGACNPVTENECYCAEPEHLNDANFCKTQIAANAAGSLFSKVACTDNTLKIDPSCACDKTNTCFEKFLQTQGATNLDLGIGNTNSPFNPITSLAHGKLEGGTLGTQAYAGTAAIAKKALNDFASRVLAGNTPLTLSQKQIEAAIIARGLPANIARIMAQNPPPQSALDAAKSKLGDFGSYQLAAYSTGKSNILDFSSGNGLGIGGKKADKKNGMEDFLGKLNPGAKGASNSKVLEFAQKAEAQASQITKSDRPLFEIISLRYQTSGRRLLQVESGN